MRDEWLDNDEYPDEDDIEAFGYDSPLDDDQLTIGYVGDSYPRFWSTGRIIVLVLALIMIVVLLLPLLSSLLR